MSQLFASGGQSIGVSASTSVLHEHPGLISFRMDWLDLLAVQGTLKSLLQHHSSKPSILWCSAFFIVQLSHPYMTTGKTIALTRQTFVDKIMSLLLNMLRWTFVDKVMSLLLSMLRRTFVYKVMSLLLNMLRRTFVYKVMSLLLNMLSRLVITFLPRSKCLLISWLQSPSAVILEPPKIKSAAVSTVSPSICHEVMGPYAMILVF